MKLNRYKHSLRSFMQEHYSDENLAQLLAHARDGKLSYHSCCCFIGLPTANHSLRGSMNDSTLVDHYIEARHMEGALAAENAFFHLGRSAPTPQESIGEMDAMRRRILIPIVRAEMKRRERAQEVKPEVELAAVSV